ncbi:MAG: hypothetical protein Q4B80_00475 [Aerococcaceae bacterium]|nr:hypothetical protein [Aerococcaceae bacterium]
MLKRKLLSVLSIFVWLLAPLNVVTAQNNEANEVLQHIREKELESESFHAKSTIKVSAQSNGQTADLFTINTEINNEWTESDALSIVSEMLPIFGEKAELEMYMRDGIYMFLSPDYITYSTFDDEMYRAIDYMNYMIAVEEEPQDSSELENKKLFLREIYMDFNQTDTEYIFTLKKGINANVFWAEFDNWLIEQTYAYELLYDLSVAGFDTSMIESTLLTPTFAKKVLETQPDLSFHYDKKTHQLAQVKLHATAKTAEFLPLFVDLFEAKAMEAETPAEVVIDANIQFDNYGQPQEVIMPEIIVEYP